jgi:hypothetical protein
MHPIGWIHVVFYFFASDPPRGTNTIPDNIRLRANFYTFVLQQEMSIQVQYEEVLRNIRWLESNLPSTGSIPSTLS